MAFKRGLTTPVGGVVLGAHHVVPRRSLRFDRERPGRAVTPAYVRSLTLTDRDLALVRTLGEFGYATTMQLAELFWHQNTRPHQKAGERLRKLWSLEVLDRDAGTQLVKYGFPLQLVYTLGRAGVLLLKEEDPAARRRTMGLLTSHNVLLLDIAVRLVAAGRQQPDWTLEAYGERTASTAFEWGDRVVRMRPDAFFLVRHGAKKLPFFVEMDTGSRPVDTFATKVLQYEMYYRSRAWRERYETFPAVLCVSWAAGGAPADLAHCQALARTRLTSVIEQTSRQRSERGIRWFFATLNEVHREWVALDADGKTQRARLGLAPSETAAVQ